MCCEELHQLDTLSVEVVSTTSEHSKIVILGLGTYLFPVDVLPKKKCEMLRRMRNPHELKVRLYATHMIYINECLYVFPEKNTSESICET